MFRFETVGDGSRPPWWRTALYVLPVSFLSLGSVVFSPMALDFQEAQATSGAGKAVGGGLVLAVGGAMLLAVLLPAGLFWRHRYPFTVTLVSAVVPLLVPIGNALPLVALAALIGRRRGPAVWWTTGLVAVTTTVVLVRDVLSQPIAASFWKVILAPVGTDQSTELTLGVTEPLVIAVTQLAVAVGAGLLLRYRREVAGVRTSVAQERAVSDLLGDEVARRQERERIAREVHDALGHRLSLLNLHAGALEANLPADARARESAQLVRQSAGAAMDDLRSLLDLLREPSLPAEAPVPLSDLARVVQESVGAGQSVNSSILIQDPDSADPALTRAIFRIVQELLTNARRHAPADPLLLTVEGSPTTGVTIDARNAYRGGWGQGGPGSSRGLAGIKERADLLGGSLRYGIDGTTFHVRVELPWRST